MKILKFGAVWCSACLIMKPRFAQIEQELPWLKTKFYDFDQSPAAVKKYQVDQGSVPAFIFLDKHGHEFLRLNGEITKDELIDIILKNKNK